MFQGERRTELSRPVRWSSSRWCHYFRTNRQTLLAIPWEERGTWSPVEKAVLGPSLQEFQLGEQSAGRNLVRAARRFARQTRDMDYPEAIRLFIAEEQRHAADLARFLTGEGLPLLQHSWRDTLFRWLRRLLGLELFLMVLLTAELIAMIYYKAIRQATSCRILLRLCAQLLRDETKHLRFHVERLAILRQDKPAWRVAFAIAFHRFLFFGTTLVVWWKHRPALKAGAYSFIRFMCESRQMMNSAFRPIKPADFGTRTPKNLLLRVG